MHNLDPNLFELYVIPIHYFHPYHLSRQVPFVDDVICGNLQLPNKFNVEKQYCNCFWGKQDKSKQDCKYCKDIY